MVVIGSLAVGYHYFRGEEGMAVRTKDADCMLIPHVEAVDAGVAITDTLLKLGWTFRAEGEFTEPGSEATPDRELPAVRLHPPGETGWFIELLTVPDPADPAREWTRLETAHGHFGLPSFRFLGLASYQPLETDAGIRIARPEMMALANLVQHSEIGPQTMSDGFAGRLDVKRSNKDLGRVVAIAWLAMRDDEDALLSWPDEWRKALEDRFRDEWRELTGRVGQGLRELIASAEDLEQAYHTCVMGLLAARQPTREQFEVAAQRLLKDAVEKCEEAG